MLEEFSKHLERSRAFKGLYDYSCPVGLPEHLHKALSLTPLAIQRQFRKKQTMEITESRKHGKPTSQFGFNIEDHSNADRHLPNVDIPVVIQVSDLSTKRQRFITIVCQALVKIHGLEGLSVMTYATAIQRLYSLAGELQLAPGKAPREFDLNQMRVLADALGNPQKRFPSILIAGTNGKGSTSATLASILQASGYHVGLLTSPHLAHVNERIRINGEDISDVDFAQCFFEVESTAHKLVKGAQLAASPSFFEMVTAIGFLAFAEAKIEVAVLEVGMGGRVDATNIVDPSVSVFTDISLDHTEWLGSTVGAIAREKAGILRNQGVMVTLSQNPEVDQSLTEVATALRVRRVNAAEYLPSETRNPYRLRNQYPIRVLGERIEVESPLGGEHQQRNLALAIATAIELRSNHGYNITPAAIATGIRDTRWPGRLEQFKASNGAEIVLDVGHNPACAWAVRSFLVRMEKRRPRTLIFSCLRDKAISEIAEILCPLFDHIIITQVNSPRAATLEELVIAFAAAGSETVETQPDAHIALARAQELTPSGGMIVGTGSFYLVGGLRAEVTSEHSSSSAQSDGLSQ